MSETLPKTVSTSSRRSMGGAVRLKRNTSVTTSNSLSDCDLSVDLDDDEDTGINAQAKRRKSTLVWESSPKRSTTRKATTFFSADLAAAETETSDYVFKDRNPRAVANSIDKEDINLSKRSSTSSSKSRSNSDSDCVLSSRELTSSKSDDSLLGAAKRPWSLEDFTLGKALGKVTKK